MNNLFFAKLLTSLAVFFLNSISVFCAFLYTRARCHSIHLHPRAPYLSYVNCFSVGLFMSVCFLGLYSSACRKMLAVQKSLDESNVLRSYPLSEAALCLNFLALWLLECVLQLLSLRTPSYRFVGSNRSSQDTPYIPLDRELTTQVIVCPEHDSAPPAENDVAAVEENPAYNCSLRSLFLVAAIGLHTLLEAVGFGLLDTTSEVLHMAVAMALHQCLCSASLGIRLAQAKGVLSKTLYSILILVGYLLVLPIGTLSACAIYDAQHPSLDSLPVCPAANISCSNQVPNLAASLTASVPIALIQNLAAATFMYMIFVEMLPAEFHTRRTCASYNPQAETTWLTPKQSVICCASAVVGFLLVSGLRFLK